MKPFFVVTLGDIIGWSLFLVILLVYAGIWATIKWGEWRASRRRAALPPKS